MSDASGEIAWGATIDASPGSGDGPKEWRVEVGSDSLGSFATDATLVRFATEVSRVAPGGAPACSLALGRFGITLTVTAPGPEEAADEGTQVFRRVLEAAVWPRSISPAFAPCDVLVRPADDAPAGG